VEARHRLGADGGRRSLLGTDDVHELFLWVFEENAESRAFYERLGWRPDGGRQVDDFGGAHPIEIRYRRSLTIV
jgi:RimJ/RimL family protein N-acetyltransferase